MRKSTLGIVYLHALEDGVVSAPSLWSDGGEIRKAAQGHPLEEAIWGHQSAWDPSFKASLATRSLWPCWPQRGHFHHAMSWICTRSWAQTSPKLQKLEDEEDTRITSTVVHNAEDAFSSCMKTATRERNLSKQAHLDLVWGLQGQGKCYTCTPSPVGKPGHPVDFAEKKNISGRFIIANHHYHLWYLWPHDFGHLR